MCLFSPVPATCKPPLSQSLNHTLAFSLPLPILSLPLFPFRNRLSACALGSEPIPSDLGSVRSSFPRGERTPFDRNMSFSEGPGSSTSATRYYRMSSNNSGFASSSSHSKDRADGSRRHTPRRSQVPAPTFGSFPHLLPVPQGLPRCTHEGVEWVFLHDNITNKSFWYCESTSMTQWMKPGLNHRMEIDTSNSDDRSGVCRSVSFIAIICLHIFYYGVVISVTYVWMTYRINLAIQ
jgi:hypothetical protein